MKLLRSNNLISHIDSLIHQETQQHDDHFDLTVGQIHEFTEAGSLDFGGSEFQPAKNRIVEPEKKDKEDDYGWWSLSSGTYRASMNEKLKGLKEGIAFIGPHSHTQEAGIITNTKILSGSEEENRITLNFRVPKHGCNIKENARFAFLYLLAI